MGEAVCILLKCALIVYCLDPSSTLVFMWPNGSYSAFMEDKTEVWIGEVTCSRPLGY